ncbi:hypothetical protein HMPREF9431_00928 [Segatella oulorum F0390]|uniref:Uncharacterized protein n=1 Tax=Segatella oulorum F0390 TaxID=702438 RepID=G1WAS7_9BACT|nr:hypothetical protein HMPREF9431_00928 [Segatella oulorum F0390]
MSYYTCGIASVYKRNMQFCLVCLPASADTSVIIFCSIFCRFRQKFIPLCPMELHNITYSIQTLQRNSKFFASFCAIYLANPNNCVNTHTHTHTHTHTQERDQYKGTRDARVIYNIITNKQRVCKKFFINFLHALFACINEQILCAKTSKVLFVTYK